MCALALSLNHRQSIFPIRMNNFLNEYFVFNFKLNNFLNKYFGLNFELNIELNHFFARFNVKMKIAAP